ncbi:hypothetical protein RCCGEPOP_13347 [Rhizobium sp. Pop5]|nr:hypothetical protein RCCGEPOP_13347 [Rhizobium sp. Pop5]
MLDGQPALHFSLRANEISKPFNLNEVELAVLEGSAGEFSLDGHSNSRNIVERVKQRCQHGLAAMDLQFGNILAGK